VPSTGVWILVAEPERRRRWERVLARFGWPLEPGGLDSLLRSEASVALVLLDAAPIRPLTEALVAIRSRSGSRCILATSAALLSNAAVIEALEQGVDDYFPESLDDRLIQAKIGAHLRRMPAALASTLETISASTGDVKLDKRARRVSVKNGRESWKDIDDLTPTEFSLLWLMIERRDAILERSLALESIWGDRAEHVGQGTVDKHVESLRRKLGPMGRRIRTVYGSGYLFSGEPA
jgi:two-component system alkaline phosphatase synthesis response regulator PhoP